MKEAQLINANVPHASTSYLLQSHTPTLATLTAFRPFTSLKWRGKKWCGESWDWFFWFFFFFKKYRRREGRASTYALNDEGFNALWLASWNGRALQFGVKSFNVGNIQHDWKRTHLYWSACLLIARYESQQRSGRVVEAKWTDNTAYKRLFFFTFFLPFQMVGKRYSPMIASRFAQFEMIQNIYVVLRPGSVHRQLDKVNLTMKLGSKLVGYFISRLLRNFHPKVIYSVDRIIIFRHLSSRSVWGRQGLC